MTAIDLNAMSPWPQFAAHSVAAGYPGVYAIPLRLNNTTLGCLNLCMTDSPPLTTEDVALAQALADLASVAIVKYHAYLQTSSSSDCTRHTLDRRIAIEQAKAMIAEHETIDMHDSFVMLWTYARHDHRGLTNIANHVVSGELSVYEIASQVGSLQLALDTEPPP